MSVYSTYSTVNASSPELFDQQHLLSMINNGSSSMISSSSYANGNWPSTVDTRRGVHPSWIMASSSSPQPFDYYHHHHANRQQIMPALPIFVDGGSATIADHQSWNHHHHSSIAIHHRHHHKSIGQSLPIMNAETSSTNHYYDSTDAVAAAAARVDVDDCWLAENNRRTFHSCPSCNKQYCRKSTLKVGVFLRER